LPDLYRSGPARPHQDQLLFLRVFARVRHASRPVLDRNIFSLVDLYSCPRRIFIGPGWRRFFWVPQTSQSVGDSTRRGSFRSPLYGFLGPHPSGREPPIGRFRRPKAGGISCGGISPSGGICARSPKSAALPDGCRA